MSWKRLWIPLLLWATLIAGFLDSRNFRTRAWIGYWKFHLSGSHTRGLLTATLFYEGYAPGGVDFQWGMVREPMRADGWTRCRWPVVIGPLQWNRTPSWELRLPTTFVIGAFAVLWLGTMQWRRKRQKARLQKLSATPPP
jgi:hypothetical protein